MLAYYVGVFYPANCEAHVHADVEGYVLSPLQLAHVVQNIRGCAVTYEHQGVAHASSQLADITNKISVLRALNRAAKTCAVPTMAPVGLVTGAWIVPSGAAYCAFVTDEALHPRLAMLTKQRVLQGLSLTHVHPRNKGECATPVEVSLCQTPARPGCSIVAGPMYSVNEVCKYKASSFGASTTMTTPASPSAERPNPIVEAISALSADQRKLISAAIESFKATITSTEADNARLRQENSDMSKAAAVDSSLLTQELDRFIARVGTEHAAAYAIEPESCARSLKSSNNEVVRRTVDRLLMCANAGMLHKRAAPHEADAHVPRVADDVRVSAKRKAESEADRDHPGNPNDPGEQLHRALAMF